MSTTSRPGRRTTQHSVVLKALHDADGFVSATELHERIHGTGALIGLATVYRHLNALAASGEADTVTGIQGQLFRACAPGGHHHHLVCELCGRAVELDTPDEEWIGAIATMHEFTPTRHVLEVFGVCGTCSSRPR